MKHVIELVMSHELANQDIGNTAKKIKSSGEVIEVVKEMEKIIRIISTVFYGLFTKKFKYEHGQLIWYF